MAEARYRISEAGILALVSTAGYAVAFSFEAGYANALGIPLEVIDVRVSTVFLAVFGLLITVLALVSYVDPLFGVLRRVASAPPSVHRVLTWWVFAGFFLYIFRPSHPLPRGIALLAGLLTAFELLLPLLTHRSVPGYVAKLRASDQDAANIPTFSRIATEALLGRFGSGLVAAFVLFLLTAALSYAYGMAQASRRDTFWVRQSSPKFVLLRVYGPNAVIAQFDREKKMLLPNYLVVPFADPTTRYHREKIGRLTPREP